MSKRVLIVVMPFLTVRRPQLGVGLLKAGLKRQGLECDVRYFNFRFADVIGAELYERISDRTPTHYLTGEWIFTPALYGPAAKPADQFKIATARSLKPYDDAFYEQIDGCRNLSAAFIRECADRIDLSQYDIVGFTSTFQQTVSSLALAQELKRRDASITTVFGGANFESEMGVELHRCFPFVDIVCSGEADSVFPELVRRLRAGQPIDDLGGVTSRVNGETTLSQARQTFIEDLNELPYPDLSDYFQAFHASTVPLKFSPELAMETSRGCWWGQKHHCTFCGLNGLSMTYRSKTSERAYQEIVHLLGVYGKLPIFNTDNIVDMRYFSELFPRLEAEGIQLQLYYETKSNLKKAQLRSLKSLGSTWFQPGIESLSSHVLELMDKGVKGIQNVQLLRWARELGFSISWNILCGFPGERPEDYQHIQRVIGSIPHLQPPITLTRFRLDRFSPLYNNAAKYGITKVRPYAAYELCFPFSDESVRRIAYFLDCEAPTTPDTLREIRKMWKDVDDWRAVHDESSLTAEITPGMLVLRDARAGHPRAEYRYAGLEREIYLAADGVHTDSYLLSNARRGHPELSMPKLQSILAEFVSRDLMLQEGNQYLALALLPADYREDTPELVEHATTLVNLAPAGAQVNV